MRWADCDPAGLVYTGKFNEYMLLAVHYFFDELGVGNYFQWVKGLIVDTSCKGLDMVFHGALWPEDEFDMHCTVSSVREHGYDILIEAEQKDGWRISTGRFSPICISREVRKRAPIPLPMLDALQKFKL